MFRSFISFIVNAVFQIHEKKYNFKAVLHQCLPGMPVRYYRKPSVERCAIDLPTYHLAGCVRRVIGGMTPRTPRITDVGFLFLLWWCVKE